MGFFILYGKGSGCSLGSWTVPLAVLYFVRLLAKASTADGVG
jgi:hypothetical protein